MGELVACKRARQHIGQSQDADVVQGSVCHEVQSTLMPRCLMTSAQRLISCSTRRVASAGVLPMVSRPICSSRCCEAGRRRVAMMDWLSLSMAACGEIGRASCRERVCQYV